MRLLHQDGGQLFGVVVLDALQHLPTGCLGGETSVVLGGEQLAGDGVHRPPHVLNRLGQALTAGPELFDLGVEDPPALREVS